MPSLCIFFTIGLGPRGGGGGGGGGGKTGGGGREGGRGGGRERRRERRREKEIELYSHPQLTPYYNSFLYSSLTFALSHFILG